MPYHRPDASYEERVAAGLAAMRVELVIFACALAAALVLGAWGFVRAGDATSKIATVARAQATLVHREAQLADLRATEARAIASAIAAERSSAILRNCEAQNARNTASIAELHRVLRPYLLRARGAQRRQLKAGARADVLLIDTFFPRQNCQQVLAQAPDRGGGAARYRLF